MFNRDNHFFIDSFEGSLDFLLCLLKKEEIDITHVPIHEIVQQCIDKLKNIDREGLERGAEFIYTISYLMWLKSKVLIPHTENSIESLTEDPDFEVIHNLLDYCRFKQVGKELLIQYEKQQSTYSRGINAPEWKKPSGVNHLSLEELSQVFTEAIRQAPITHSHAIQEEHWRVSDKIRFLRSLLQVDVQIPLLQLFTQKQSRQEIIVIFLAILELMKCGEIHLYKDSLSTLFIRPFSADHNAADHNGQL